jgi:hypothetical protein
MQMSCQSTNKSSSDAARMRKIASAGIDISSVPQSDVIAGVSPALPSALNLHSAFFGQLGIPQRQQLLQLQIQQQVLHQEIIRQALLGSSSRLIIPPFQSGIQAVSMHMGPQQQDHMYSQLLAAQLAQGDLRAPHMGNGNSSVAHQAFLTAGKDIGEGKKGKSPTATPTASSFVSPPLPPST